MEERFIEVEPGVRLWAQAAGDPEKPALLLIMGANATGIAWPDALVEHLAEHHRVIRYDHRDTGRSTRAYAEHPYPIRQLAPDALAVLDGFGIQRAHVVGMSLGGLLIQLLMLDAPERLLSATLFCTGALGGDPPLPGEDGVPGPSEEVLALWQHLGEPRTREEEIAFNLEHWRVLSGPGGYFEPEEFRALEARVRAHTGHADPLVAHALADQSELTRGRELAGVTTPTLVIDAPLDPVFAPPNAEHLARVIPGARLTTIPRMGHALPAAVLSDLAEAILSITDHRAVTRREFARQVGEFERPDSFFGDREVLEWIAAHVPVSAEDVILDVAGGAGHVGRFLTERGRFGVVVDLTREMLAAGVAAGQRDVVFVEGDAAALPFSDNQFDVVVCRFAFHHMDQPQRAAAEMARVARPGGTVAVIDMLDGGARHNELERLRDPSHTRALAEDELLGMLDGAAIVAERTQRVPAVPWLERAGAADPRVLGILEAEADGGPATGMHARRGPEGLSVAQRWVIAVGSAGEHA